MLLLDQEVDHVAHGEGGCFLQVGAEAHADVVGWRLSARPEQVLVLVHDELEGSAQESLHCGDINLAVALARMAVANLEERSFDMYRDVERGARHQFLVIHVAGVHPRRRAVDASRGWGRGNTHAAEEGVQRNLDARCELGHHPLAVEGDNFRSAVRIVVGQKSASGCKAIAGEGCVEVDLEDLHFEHVAGLSFGDVDGAGKDMAARSLVLHLAVDVGVVGRDVGGGDAFLFQSLRGAAGGERLDMDGISRVNGEDGFGLGRIVAPDHGRRSGGQVDGRGLRGNDAGQQQGHCGSKNMLHRWLP